MACLFTKLPKLQFQIPCSTPRPIISTEPNYIIIATARSGNLATDGSQGSIDEGIYKFNLVSNELEKLYGYGLGNWTIDWDKRCNFAHFVDFDNNDYYQYDDENIASKFELQEDGTATGETAFVGEFIIVMIIIVYLI